MSKFEELSKVPGKDIAPTAPKGAPLEITEALGGRKASEQAIIPIFEQAPQPLTAEGREELKGRLLSALTVFALTAPIPNAEAIPFTPDAEPRAVKDRIAQGPAVYRSNAERDAKEKLPPPVTAPITKNRPTIAHPDMLRPGRYIKGDSPPYRPV